MAIKGARLTVVDGEFSGSVRQEPVRRQSNLRMIAQSVAEEPIQKAQHKDSGNAC